MKWLNWLKPNEKAQSQRVSTVSAPKVYAHEFERAKAFMDSQKGARGTRAYWYAQLRLWVLRTLVSGGPKELWETEGQMSTAILIWATVDTNEDPEFWVGVFEDWKADEFVGSVSFIADGSLETKIVTKLTEKSKARASALKGRVEAAKLNSSAEKAPEIEISPEMAAMHAEVLASFKETAEKIKASRQSSPNIYGALEVVLITNYNTISTHEFTDAKTAWEFAKDRMIHITREDMYYREARMFLLNGNGKKLLTRAERDDSTMKTYPAEWTP